MSVPALSQEMLAYFNKLNEVEQKTFLQLLKTFFKNRKQGLSSQSVEDYTKELEDASREIEAGNFVMHEDVLKYFGVSQDKKKSKPKSVASFFGKLPKMKDGLAYQKSIRNKS